MILTAKVNWKSLSAVLSLAAAFVLCFVGGQMETRAVSASVPDDVMQAHRDYLAALGWETEGLVSTDRVILPEEFTPEYEAYLSVQADGGFDLLPCAGKTVTRYTYAVSNYPSGEEEVLADLLVLDGAVVGGELRSAALDGFMIGLVPREQVSS
ncbi:MAG: DUF4830 domain-containing protein [Clostridiales bacterium]|nr:DUF4830 domain-containing protein [Clostridiales bacterium]MCD7753145.1 DUF4830 domain-containing protein [Clostridiales bacterium]MCD7802816.1 DUF4830 domain-containing protein [Clostridiales bacterium]